MLFRSSFGDLSEIFRRPFEDLSKTFRRSFGDFSETNRHLLPGFSVAKICICFATDRHKKGVLFSTPLLIQRLSSFSPFPLFYLCVPVGISRLVEASIVQCLPQVFRHVSTETGLVIIVYQSGDFCIVHLPDRLQESSCSVFVLEIQRQLQQEDILFFLFYLLLTAVGGILLMRLSRVPPYSILQGFM